MSLELHAPVRHHPRRARSRGSRSSARPCRAVPSLRIMFCPIDQVHQATRLIGRQHVGALLHRGDVVSTCQQGRTELRDERDRRLLCA